MADVSTEAWRTAVLNQEKEEHSRPREQYICKYPKSGQSRSHRCHVTVWGSLAGVRGDRRWQGPCRGGVPSLARSPGAPGSRWLCYVWSGAPPASGGGQEGNRNGHPLLTQRRPLDELVRRSGRGPLCLLGRTLVSFVAAHQHSTIPRWGSRTPFQHSSQDHGGAGRFPSRVPRRTCGFSWAPMGLCLSSPHREPPHWGFVVSPPKSTSRTPVLVPGWRRGQRSDQERLECVWWKARAPERSGPFLPAPSLSPQRLLCLP